MPRYLFHVGPHKTGSTYLQVSLEDLREVLEAQSILFPRKWQAGPGHAELVERLRALDPKLVPEFAEMNSSGYQTIILSAEDISDLSLGSLKFLKECIGNSDATVVFYCRRWSELLTSGWQELVKHGDAQSFPEFFAAHMANPFGSSVMNFSRRLDRFAEVFGISNLKLVSYNNVVEQGGNIGTHFFRNVLAVKDIPECQESRINASLGILDTEIVRSLNAIEWATNRRRGSDVLRAYMRAKSSLDLEPLLAIMLGYKRRIRLNESAGSALMLHQKIVEEYGPSLIPPTSGQYLFRLVISDIEYIGADYLVHGDVLHALRNIHEGLSVTSPQG